MRKIAILVAIVLSNAASSQVHESTDLYKSISKSDSLVFDIGFNTCDIEVLQDLISDEFVFFHDQGGITSSKAAFLESIQGICGLPYTAKRALIRSATSIYPLHRNDTLYGAIQHGEHRFFAEEGANQKYLTSIASFTHVWLLDQKAWKLSTVLSYNHRDVEKHQREGGLFTDTEVTNKWLQAKSIPALGIGFIDNGQIVQTSVFGELTHQQAAPLSTIWNVASMTKAITACITLKLADQGHLDLDEPICTYYTDSDVLDDPRSRILTTRMILSHQSGLPNWRGDKADGKLTFEFTPRTEYQYSGEGFEYLRKALEVKFSRTLEQLASDLVFDPLEMHDTQLVWSKAMEEKPFAKWHNAEKELYDTDTFFEANAADNLLTTVEDYSKFMLHILRGAGLSEELQNDMVAEQVRIGARKHFGLGWWIDEHLNAENESAIVFAGDDIGVHCIAFLLPKSEKALLIFTNSDNGTDAYQEVISHYLKEHAEGIFKAEMGE